MKIGVIGLGVIGKALFDAFSPVFPTVGYDKVGFFSGEEKFKDLLNCGIVFVCVPTPTINGKQDQSALTDVFSKLANAGYNGIIVNRCTVKPGTTRYFRARFALRIIHNPEFVTAAKPFEDFMAQKSILLGGPMSECFLVAEAYRKVLPEATAIMRDEFEVTELAKYMRNIYLACKVTFANEMAEICSRVGIDYNDVLSAMLSIGGIEQGHFKVPGPDGKRGYSGMCFPKDIKALLEFTDQIHLDIPMIAAADVSNEMRRPHDSSCKEIAK